MEAQHKQEEQDKNNTKRVSAVIDSLDDYVKLLPKTELHAHLNGSISLELLQTLAKELPPAAAAADPATNDPSLQTQLERDLVFSSAHTEQMLATLKDPTERMGYCFTKFDAIYKIMTTLSNTERAVYDVIEHYATENTIYLELRTSLRSVEGKSLEHYLRKVVSSIDKCVEESRTKLKKQEEEEEDNSSHQNHKAVLPFSRAESIHEKIARMKINVLVSINRGSPIESAEETIDIAVNLKKEPNSRIVGIDFCGNCYKNQFSDFVPALQRARDNGLKITLHAGEKDDRAELLDMVRFQPERYGHLVFCDDDAKRLIMEQRAPLEICLTSNMLTTNYSSADEHHVAEWAAARHPVSINTDDRGVFCTSLTREYQLFLSIRELWGESSSKCAKGIRQLVEDSIVVVAADGHSSSSHAFLREGEAQELRDLFRLFDATYYVKV